MAGRRIRTPVIHSRADSYAGRHLVVEQTACLEAQDRFKLGVERIVLSGGIRVNAASEVSFERVEVLALAITGQPAAIDAAKSPPAILLNANGKLFGPNTHTGPIAVWHERIFNWVSMVGIRQLPVRAARAAERNWPVVRGNSMSARRGCTGSAVSACAMATIASLFRSRPSAYRSKNRAINSPEMARSLAAARTAASSAASTSVQLLIGYTAGSGAFVAGLSA